MRMLRLSGPAAIVLCLLVPFAALGQGGEVGGPADLVGDLDGEPTSFLFVISGEGVKIDGDVLTLIDAPSVLYFSDRPNRSAGHMDPDSWVKTWDLGPGSFADVPPNAVLVAGAPAMHEVVLELLDTTVDGEDLRFRFEVLDGHVPSEPLGPASLFIDGSSIAPYAADAAWLSGSQAAADIYGGVDLRSRQQEE